MKGRKSTFDNATCSNCGATLSGNEGPFCLQCRIEGAESSIPELKERGRAVKFRVHIWKYARWIIIVISFSICAYFLFNMHKMLAPEKPIRNGYYGTDTVADECIQNLWRISALLQAHKKIPDNIVCPLSEKPYSVTEKRGGVIVVSCPNPEKHECHKLEVNSHDPVPEVRK